jgi:hypothetical protein
METLHYKGYHIQATPYMISGTAHWRMKIDISSHSEDLRPTKSFYARNIFTTREEAAHHCLTFGMEIVDGKYFDCRLDR